MPCLSVELLSFNFDHLGIEHFDQYLISLVWYVWSVCSFLLFSLFLLLFFCCRSVTRALFGGPMFFEPIIGGPLYGLATQTQTPLCLSMSKLTNFRVTLDFFSRFCYSCAIATYSVFLSFSCIFVTIHYVMYFFLYILYLLLAFFLSFSFLLQQFALIGHARIF